MSSYMNDAHLYERNSDRFARRGDFDAAISCRSAAMDSLAKARSTPLLSPSILESIDLQRRAQEKGIEQLIAKKERFIYLRSVREKQLEQGKLQYQDKLGNSAAAATPIHSSPPEESVQESLIRSCVVLQELNYRSCGRGDNSAKVATSCAWKGPKTDADVIEELRLHNFDLRSHIASLLSELDETKRKNSMLEASLCEMTKSRNPSSLDNAVGDNVALLSPTDGSLRFNFDLPPLEMPPPFDIRRRDEKR